MSKGIYCYIDKKDDSVVYVGRDSNIHIDKRHKQHFEPSSYSRQQVNRVLQNNPNRYTYKRLWEIEDCTNNHLNEMEKYYTKIYDPKFSFTEGGSGTSGYKWTDEQKKKISGENSHNWGKKNPEHSERMKGENNPCYGRTGKKHPMYRKKRPEHSEKMKGENNPFYNKKHKEESKRKMSKTRSEKYNTTGFYRVSIGGCQRCKKGFSWRYRYYVNSQRKTISSNSLKMLEKRVRENNLEWKIIDNDKAKQSILLDGCDI